MKSSSQSLYPTRGWSQATKSQRSSQSYNVYAPESPKEDPNNIYKCLLATQGPNRPQQAHSSENRAPLLRLTVNLGNNNQDTIVVKEGDDLENIANDFCKKNNLDDESFEFVLRNIDSNYKLAISERKNIGPTEGKSSDSKRSKKNLRTSTSRNKKRGVSDAKKQGVTEKCHKKANEEEKKEERKAVDLSLFERLYGEAKQKRLKSNLNDVEYKKPESNEMQRANGNSVEAGKRLYESGMKAKFLKS